MNVGTIHRARIAVDALCRNLFRRLIGRQTPENKRILIVFQQVFGDAVLLSNSLPEYCKLFPRTDGYEVTMIARPSVLAFMRAVLPLPREMRFEEVDFKRYLEDYSYYRSVNKAYRGTYGTLIVPGTSMSAMVFCAASDASRKVGLALPFPISSPLAMALFDRIAYGERAVPQKEDMQLQRHRLLLHHLGAADFKAKLPVLLPKERIIPEARYCVICPGASKTEKFWPVERFAEISDYIIEKYDMQIHLCGGADETEQGKKLQMLVKHPDQIVNHIGKTNFSDWSAIVQHATLVLGNDSATLHLAAAARRHAICIAGIYDKDQFFPYKVDDLADTDVLPVTILKDKPCAWCRTSGYYAGYGNRLCMARIQSGKCALCIDEITVQEVIKTIDAILKEI